MKLLYRILILLNLTALVLLFLYIFIYPLYHTHPSLSPSLTQPSPPADYDYFLRYHQPPPPPSTSTSTSASPGDSILINCSQLSPHHLNPSPTTTSSSSSSSSSQQSLNLSWSLTENELLVERIFLSHVQETQRRFQSHPGHEYQRTTAGSLEDYMLFLSQRRSCHLKPIFLTMARVSSELYWQLIENYFYTMSVSPAPVSCLLSPASYLHSPPIPPPPLPRCRHRRDHFGHLDCTVMVCVTDPVCVRMCRDANFPCFNYVYEKPKAPTFEQVAAIKLKHTALALDKGVTILLLDLDVGFLRDPLILMEGFLEHDNIQVRAQMDIGWAMDKKQGMTWTTFPRANFGLFLVKGNELSAKLFHRAWNEYVRKTYPREVIYKPTLLLHKVEDHSIHGVRFELGGVAAQEELGASIAIHATCYEKTSKLLVLKVSPIFPHLPHSTQTSNAFWGDKYYNPSKKTLVKPLMLATTPEDLLSEVKTLAFIAMVTNRSLILPNILVGIGLDLPGKKRSRYPYFDYRVNARNALPPDQYPRKGNPKSLPMSHCPRYGSTHTLASSHANTDFSSRDNLYWPGFRTIYSTITGGFEILEPGFYAKIEEQLHLTVPEPHILSWTMAGDNSDPWGNIHQLIETINRNPHPRLVLDLLSPGAGKPEDGKGRPWNLINWAKHSVSSWGGPSIQQTGYVPIDRFPISSPRHLEPNFITSHRVVLQHLKLCEKFLIAPNGNRSCFNKCN